MPEKSMHDLFVEDGALVEKAFTSLDSAFKSLINGNIEEAKKFVEETIQHEKAQDRLREEIVGRLYTKETMVFSRPDRLKLVRELDDIVDKTEMVARFLIQNEEVKIPDTIKGKIVDITDKFIVIGQKVNLLVQKVLTDFNAAKPICKDIEDMRRDVKSILWEISGDLFNLNLNPIDFWYFQNIVNQIRKAVDEAEDFSDKMVQLLCKYAL